MIEILPALPSEAPPKPKEQIVDLVAMKRYEADVGFADGLDFWTRHDMAVRWANQRDHEFDAGRGDYYR